MEKLFVDCEESFLGIVVEKLSLRKSKMVNLVNNGSGRVRIELSAPSRALIGYRDEFLTDTRGTGILNSIFDGYGEYRGDCYQPVHRIPCGRSYRDGSGLCPVQSRTPRATLHRTGRSDVRRNGHW